LELLFLYLLASGSSLKKRSCGRIIGLKKLKLLYKRFGRMSTNKLSLPF
jgi:hypothetical protein